MNKASLSAVAPLVVNEKVVTITIAPDGTATIEPSTLRVEHGFDGVINWVIEHLDARFTEPPIEFEDDAIAVPPATRAKLAQLPWNNHNPSAEPISYPYSVNLLDGFRSLKPDPTVENDPPGYIREAQSRA
jgi:hypothetical protein